MARLLTGLNRPAAALSLLLAAGAAVPVPAAPVDAPVRTLAEAYEAALAASEEVAAKAAS